MIRMIGKQYAPVPGFGSGAAAGALKFVSALRRRRRRPGPPLCHHARVSAVDRTMTVVVPGKKLPVTVSTSPWLALACGVADERVEVVHVTSPNHLHHPQVKEILELAA